MNIALLHYTYGPVVGGGESILEQHARLFTQQKHKVRVICGIGESMGKEKVEMVVEFRREYPLTKKAQAEAEKGAPGADFAKLKAQLVKKLEPMLAKMDIVFLHNVLSMPFNLALTAALWELADKLPRTRFVAWVHDLAACNPDYALPHLDREPWSLLTKRHPRISYVAVSTLRQRQFAGLTGTPVSECPVIPNGIAHVTDLDLTDTLAKLVKERAILEKDIVLLLPARILKRKNIELGIRVAAELKKTSKSCACLFTGAPDPHNAASQKHHEALLQLRAELGVKEEFVFLHEFFAVTNRDVSGLYRVADALFFPSKQEGFGLPILEGALHRIPIFTSDIEPMKSILTENVTFFDPQGNPAEIAATIASAIAQSPSLQARKRVVRDYSWKSIYPKYLAPLLEKPIL